MLDQFIICNLIIFELHESFQRRMPRFYAGVYRFITLCDILNALMEAFMTAKCVYELCSCYHVQWHTFLMGFNE